MGSAERRLCLSSSFLVGGTCCSESVSKRLPQRGSLRAPGDKAAIKEKVLRRELAETENVFD